MGDAWDVHKAAAASAAESVGELQESLAVATERCEMAIGMVAVAVGHTDMESGRMALALLQGAKDLIAEAWNTSSAAVEELQRYNRGF